MIFNVIALYFDYFLNVFFPDSVHIFIHKIPPDLKLYTANSFAISKLQFSIA